jgi:hypothetical protein
VARGGGGCGNEKKELNLLLYSEADVGQPAAAWCGARRVDLQRRGAGQGEVDLRRHGAGQGELNSVGGAVRDRPAPFHHGRLDLASTPPPDFGVPGTVKVVHSGGCSRHKQVL